MILCLKILKIAISSKICLKTGLEWPTFPFVIWILYCQALWVSTWLACTYSLKLGIYEWIIFLNTLKMNIFDKKLSKNYLIAKCFPCLKNQSCAVMHWEYPSFITCAPKYNPSLLYMEELCKSPGNPPEECLSPPHFPSPRFHHHTQCQSCPVEKEGTHSCPVVSLTCPSWPCSWEQRAPWPHAWQNKAALVRPASSHQAWRTGWRCVRTHHTLNLWSCSLLGWALNSSLCLGTSKELEMLPD